MSSYRGEMQRMQAQVEEMEKLALSTGALRGGAAYLGGLARRGTGGVKEFAQRQLHGFTGWTPKASNREAAMKAMGFKVPKGGSPEELSQLALQNVQKGKVTGHLPERVQKWMASSGAKRDVARREAMLSGDTSMPGLIKNIATDPRATLSRAVRGASPTDIALGAGLTAPFVYQSAKERDVGGVGGTLAENALYSLAPLPIAPMIVGGSLLRKGTEALGRGAQRLIRPKPGSPTPTPSGTLPGGRNV